MGMFDLLESAVNLGTAAASIPVEAVKGTAKAAFAIADTAADAAVPAVDAVAEAASEIADSIKETASDAADGIRSAFG